MLLREFFQNPKEKSQNQQPDLIDKVYWYILDNDYLYKKFCLPIIHSGNIDSAKKISTWAPMVGKGCIMFYNEHNMSGHPKNLFDKELRQEVCNRLAEYYAEEMADEQKD